MVWKIRASPEVLGPEGTGVRTRSVCVGGTRRPLQFGKEPVFLNVTVLPPEIEQDIHLVKTLVRDGEAPLAQMVCLDERSDSDAPVVDAAHGRKGSGRPPKSGTRGSKPLAKV